MRDDEYDGFGEKYEEMGFRHRHLYHEKERRVFAFVGS